MRKGQRIEKGDIVLLKTGYGERFQTEEMQGEACMSKSPYLTDDAVNWLIEKRIKLLGIDLWSIEEFPSIPVSANRDI